MGMSLFENPRTLKDLGLQREAIPVVPPTIQTVEPLMAEEVRPSSWNWLKWLLIMLSFGVSLNAIRISLDKPEIPPLLPPVPLPPVRHEIVFPPEHPVTVFKPKQEVPPKPKEEPTAVVQRAPQFVLDEALENLGKPVQPQAAVAEDEPEIKSVFHLDRVFDRAQEARRKGQMIIWWVGMSPEDSDGAKAFFRSTDKWCHVFTQKMAEGHEHGERLVFDARDGRQWFVKLSSINDGTKAKIEKLLEPDRKAAPDPDALGPGIAGVNIGGENFLNLLNKQISYTGRDGRKVVETLGDFLAGGGDCADDQLLKAIGPGWGTDAVKVLRDYQQKVTGGVKGPPVKRKSDGSRGIGGQEPEVYFPPPPQRVYQGWEFGLPRQQPWFGGDCIGGG